MLKCTCEQEHPVNGRRGDGMAVALWTCPEHGNLFEERPLGITLTHQQIERSRARSELRGDPHCGGAPLVRHLVRKVRERMV